MSGIITRIEQALIENIFSYERMFSVKSTASRAFSGLSIALSSVGAGFLLYAGYLKIAATYTAEDTAVIAGAAFLALAMLCTATAWLVMEYNRVRMKKARRTIAEQIGSALSVLEDELGDPIRDYPIRSVLAAALAGFMLEDRIL